MTNATCDWCGNWHLVTEHAKCAGNLATSALAEVDRLRAIINHREEAVPYRVIQRQLRSERRRADYLQRLVDRLKGGGWNPEGGPGLCEYIQPADARTSGGDLEVPARDLRQRLNALNEALGRPYVIPPDIRVTAGPKATDALERAEAAVHQPLRPTTEAAGQD